MNRDDITPKITVQPRVTDGTTRPADGDEAQTLRIAPGLDAQDSDANQIGQLSSHYSIQEKIGQGGMGIVYLAKDHRLGRFVAIKRLNRNALARPSLKERFMREAKAIASLSHIHIVHIYALGEDPDGPYIVMEYLAGPQAASPNKTPPAPFSLADRVHRSGPFSVSDALDLVIKICRAMEYAHSSGVIHRDLKPSNVLLDETGEPKIVDFGLARKLGIDDDPITVPGEKMLSLGYGAPEQESDASVTDHRADIYGLGAILYFSITGQNPRYFRENDVPELLRMPLLKALETDRNKRWGTVREFTNALLVIKAPSTIELPTVKKTWRCKWCDTINPTTIQFCGSCGWDGGEGCPECQSETRVGIQFCGACGANAREYETAVLLLGRLKQYRDRKAYELIPQHAERIGTFRPLGPGGRKIVDQVHALRQEAEKAMERRIQLRQLIKRELVDENYERAKEDILEYDALTTDGAYVEDLKAIPELTLRRDIKRAGKALDNMEWEYAERTCRHILESSGKDNPEVLQILKLIKYHRARIRVRNSAIAVIVVFFSYIMSAAPVYRFAGKPDSRGYKMVYDLSLLIHDATFMRRPMEAYAAIWGVRDMYLENNTEPAGTPPLSVTSAVTVDKMSQLRSKYETAQLKVETEHAKRIGAWPTEYVAALNDLLTKAQKAGDFENWSAVKEELIRFDQDRRIPEKTAVTAPQDLIALQAKYAEQISRFMIERSAKTLQLVQEYVNELTQLQKDLTMHGKMAEAGKVNAEIKRVKSTPEVTAAMYEIEQSKVKR